MSKERKLRILVVEDEELIAQGLQRYLQQLQYEVSAIVVTGEDAILQVRQNPPELVLMDITLSGKINGIQASRQIQSFSHIPVVYITARADIEQWQEAKITEPFGYIIKPFELRELEVVLAAAFYKFYKEEEIFAISNSCHNYLESFGGIIMRSDLDFNPLFMHGPVERIMGYKADEIIKGTPRLEDILHPEERPLFSPDDHQKLRTLPDFSMTKECRIVTRDNQTRWVRETIKNILNQSGKPVMIERVIRDITDHKDLLCKLEEAKGSFQESQKQLLQLQKMAAIGQLAAGVVHEINNPMGFIGNNIEVLRQYIVEYAKMFKVFNNLSSSVTQGNIEEAKSTVQEAAQLAQEVNLEYIVSDIDKLLDHTQQGIERVKKIVMDLRTFVRRTDDILEMTDVEAVMEGIIGIVWNEIKYKAEIKKEYGKIPPVRCNAQEVGQVFINLLINAAQSIKEKGEITIRTYIADNQACIAISDTGCGIASKNLDKMFVPFFTTKGSGLGTGLGLSVSQGIIKRYKGDILIESQVDKGTTFTVIFPLNTDSTSSIN